MTPQQRLCEAARAVVSKATPSGPLWHGSGEMVALRAALDAMPDEDLDAAVLDAAEAWEQSEDETLLVTTDALIHAVRTRRAAQEEIR